MCSRNSQLFKKDIQLYCFFPSPSNTCQPIPVQLQIFIVQKQNKISSGYNHSLIHAFFLEQIFILHNCPAVINNVYIVNPISIFSNQFVLCKIRKIIIQMYCKKFKNMRVYKIKYNNLFPMNQLMLIVGCRFFYTFFHTYIISTNVLNNL